MNLCCCSGGGGSGGSAVTVPGCVCPEIPATLTLAWTGGTNPYNLYQNATLVYATTSPVSTASGVASGAAWYAGPFNETLTGNQFYYQANCYYNSFYVDFIAAPGSPLASGYALSTWTLGGDNTCSPFNLVTTYSSDYSGTTTIT